MVFVLLYCCRWTLPASRFTSQQQLLTALHHHCMQLLAQARDLLPPQACTLGQHSSSTSSTTNRSSSGSNTGQSGSSTEAGSSLHGEQATGAVNSSSSSSAGVQQQQLALQAREVLQQQRDAWQLCLAHVQHNLLLVMQLTKHWQHHNAHLCLDMVLSKDRYVEGLQGGGVWYSSA